jgi:Transposase Tn5 dimerisation domain
MHSAERGTHLVELTDDRGKTFNAKLEVRFRRMTVRPPIGKQKQYPALELTVIHAREVNCPKGREPIEWKLLTDLPVTNLREATEKLDWYAMRWKIEMFHKVLKSGCRAEEAKLRSAQRLTNLLAIYCIVSWRVFWMCMINRTSPRASATLVFTDTELQLLDHADPKPSPAPKKTISDYLYALARLGGYLSRAHDPPPGNMVLWRGFIRLMDIHLGYCMAAGVVGN